MMKKRGISINRTVGIGVNRLTKCSTKSYDFVCPFVDKGKYLMVIPLMIQILIPYVRVLGTTVRR